jgi:uncharacterized protein YydD (DUF2326 family)
MRLSKIYSNNDNVFLPINFKSGLNAIVAEIKLYKDEKRDTHNLGKTTLSQLIDYCLLSRSHNDNNFFLIKHKNIFKDFAFFLEIEISNENYLTIKRSVATHTKINFKRHSDKNQDFSEIAEEEWDHNNIAFDKAKNILDGILGFEILNNWTFRDTMGYLLRSQEDYTDVFQLSKFKGEQSQWKPFLAHLLGFNAEVITELYNAEKSLAELKKQEFFMVADTIDNDETITKIESMIILHEDDLKQKESFLNSFDFSNDDREKIEKVAKDLNIKIAHLNNQKYYMAAKKEKLEESLENTKILFNVNEAEKLFNEAGILFGGAIKKDFEQLLKFNVSITKERKKYLNKELKAINESIIDISKKIDELSKQRVDALSFLESKNILDKYKTISNEVAKLKSNITILENKRNILSNLQKLRDEKHLLENKLYELRRKIESNIYAEHKNEHSLFSKIAHYFNEIIKETIDHKAVLSVSLNKEYHLEFKPDILDETGTATSANAGHTYKKLLCIAFDMAVLRAYSDKNFPKFVYHDGIFESLDDRKKVKLLSIIRKYSEYGIQHLFTAIDSDFPVCSDENTFLDNDEIVLRLHDDGNSGRLFKMDPW